MESARGSRLVFQHGMRRPVLTLVPGYQYQVPGTASTSTCLFRCVVAAGILCLKCLEEYISKHSHLMNKVSQSRADDQKILDENKYLQ